MTTYLLNIALVAFVPHYHTLVFVPQHHAVSFVVAPQYHAYNTSPVQRGHVYILDVYNIDFFEDYWHYHL